MSDVKTRSIYIQNSKCLSVCELLSGAENPNLAHGYILGP